MLFVLFFDANSKKFLFLLHFKSDMLFLVGGKGSGLCSGHKTWGL